MKKKSGILLLAAALFTCLGGCGGPLYTEDSPGMPGATLSVVATPPVQDARARFRELFCRVLSSDTYFGDDPAACEKYLWRLDDEPMPGDGSGFMPPHDTRYKILFVSGLFSECTWRTRKPFETAALGLKQAGYDANWVTINGLSSSSHNAGLIAREINGIHLAEGESLILVGHSKGTVDILHFLVDYPRLTRKVAAVISVAGAVNGSPLAAYLQNAGNKLVQSVPEWVCPPGDDRALASLQPAARMKWIATHPLPDGVSYFSIVGYTRADNVSAGLLGTYKRLRTIHPRNDGLLIYYDQVIPGSALLGYANADHWAIAMPADNASFFTQRIMNKNRYPRASLLEAAVLYAVESMAAGKRR